MPIAAFDYYSVGAGIESGPLYTRSGALYGVLAGSQTGVGALYSVQNGQIVDIAYIAASGFASPQAQPFVTSGGSFIGTAADSGLCTNCGFIWGYRP